MATYRYGFSKAFLLFVLLAAMLVASQPKSTEPAVTAKDIEGDPTDPWYHRKLPPQPRPGYNAYLGNCLTQITKPCGKQMFAFIFNKVEKIDDKCCCKLENAGKLCNKAVSWTLSHLDQFKPKASLILTRSDLAFDTCSTKCKKF